MKTRLYVCFFTGSLLGLAVAVGAQPRTAASLSYYFDSRDYNTVTLLSATDGLPLGFAVWGFADFHGAPGRGGQRFDMTRYFIEYRLLRAVDPAWVGGVKGLGLLAEYNDAGGGGNVLVRFGASYGRALPFGRLQVKLFPIETDGDGGQVAFSYRVDLGQRLYIGGFADYNVSGDGPERWVAEPQLVWRLDGRFSLLVEYRYNGFERRDSGLAAGGELKF